MPNNPNNPNDPNDPNDVDGVGGLDGVDDDAEKLGLDYTDGTPTFDYVRDRIEKRVGTAIGAAELSEALPEAAEAQDRYEKTKEAGKDRLEELRRSLREE